MSDYYLENYHGEFEDQEDVVWNELDWQQYLTRNKRDIRKLMEFYKTIRYNRTGYLEEICQFMNWGEFDIFSLQDTEVEESLFDSSFSITQEDGDERAENEAETDPYTIHKHPLHCLSMAIYQYIQDQCEELLVSGKNLVSAIEIWRLSTSFLAGQSNVLMAIYSIDVGDNILAICHLKHVLNAVNESFRVLHQMPNTLLPVKEITLSLFTFREVLLKVLTDCREHDGSEFGEIE